jgi:hypothetical protein
LAPSRLVPRKKIVKNQADRKSGPKNRAFYAQKIISRRLNFDQRGKEMFPGEPP